MHASCLVVNLHNFNRLPAKMEDLPENVHFAAVELHHVIKRYSGSSERKVDCKNPSRVCDDFYICYFSIFLFVSLHIRRKSEGLNK